MVQFDDKRGGTKWVLHSPLSDAPFTLESRIGRRIWAAAEGLNGFGANVASVADLGVDDHSKPENTTLAKFLKLTIDLASPNWIRPQENPTMTRVRMQKAKLMVQAKEGMDKKKGILVDEREYEEYLKSKNKGNVK
jgi:hypothetical protein